MNTSSYDDQAKDFELRAGLPESVVLLVVQALMMYSEIDDGRFFEVGAGTEAIGACLLDQGINYYAIDRSPAMLEVFTNRIGLRHQERI